MKFLCVFSSTKEQLSVKEVLCFVFEQMITVLAIECISVHGASKVRAVSK